jgi:glycosyltransferase involved in cell wall biosynthesis
LRVLFVCQAFRPHFEGGTERVARVHAKALREAGHELAIIAAAPPGAAQVGCVEGLDTYFVEDRLLTDDPLAERLLIERPERCAAVLQLARDWAPDVVHIQHLAGMSLGLTAALASLGLPVFHSLHDLFVTCPRFFRDPLEGVVCPPVGELAACAACLAPEAPELEANVLEPVLGERVRRMRAELEAATGLFAPSASHARRLEELLALAPDSIAVLPNGLTEDYTRGTVAPLPVAPGAPLELLSFGHRVRTKGLVELVRAAAAAARRVERPLHLTLLGAPLEPGLDVELARLAPPLRLTLEGPYDHARLTTAAGRAHVALFPSKALESYGLVVDEALALGLPVMAADAGALGERVGAAGLVLPRPLGAPEVEAWAAALVELALDPTRLEAWRAAIPDRMPGPRDAAALLLEHYSLSRS